MMSYKISKDAVKQVVELIGKHESFENIIKNFNSKCLRYLHQEYRLIAGPSQNYPTASTRRTSNKHRIGSPTSRTSLFLVELAQ